MRPTSTAVPATPLLRIPFSIMVTVFCLLWASAFSVAKLAMADCPPLLLLTFRFLGAGVLVLAAAVIFGLSLKRGRRHLLLFVALGVPTKRRISASAMSAFGPSRRGFPPL